MLALTLASAAAFVAPKAAARGPVAIQSFRNEVGAQVPLGYWDPLAILENADQDKFDRLRFTEIKHGRISMIAVVGYLFGASNVRWAGFADVEHTLKFADVPGAALEAALLDFCERTKKAKAPSDPAISFQSLDDSFENNVDVALVGHFAL